jgi:hypothetical protein
VCAGAGANFVSGYFPLGVLQILCEFLFIVLCHELTVSKRTGEREGGSGRWIISTEICVEHVQCDLSSVTECDC